MTNMTLTGPLPIRLLLALLLVLPAAAGFALPIVNVTPAANGAGEEVAAAACAPGATMRGSRMPCVDVSQIPAAGRGASTDLVQPTDEKPTGSDIGAFRSVCNFSHMSFADPIVYPGIAMATHLHVFFGNTGTDEKSTKTSIAETGNSTCRGGTINRTAYWVPAMINTDNGAPIKPRSSNFYYKQGYSGLGPLDMHAFPLGLRMVAGDAASKTTQPGIIAYSCSPSDGRQETWHQNIPTICRVGDVLKMSISFPQCWDGKNLDSPDHKAHMAYPSGGKCDKEHPVAGPQIAYQIEYDVTGSTASWRLSSDNYAGPGGNSGHGDWFNGWKPKLMDAFVNGCLRASADCHSHLLGNGQAMQEVPL